jgi:hypothetical protein
MIRRQLQRHPDNHFLHTADKTNISHPDGRPATLSHPVSHARLAYGSGIGLRVPARHRASHGRLVMVDWSSAMKAGRSAHRLSVMASSPAVLKETWQCWQPLLAPAVRLMLCIEKACWPERSFLRRDID